MNPCTPHEENLALLAGGDLESSQREAELREHVETCAGCRALLEELGADRAVFADLARADLARSEAAAEAGSLAPAVVGELSRSASRSAGPGRRSAHDSPAASEAASSESRRGWRVAAAAFVALASGWIGLEGLQHLPGSSEGPGEERAAVVAEARDAPSGVSADGSPVLATRSGNEKLPVAVRRWEDGGVELTWKADGRQAGTYRVLASPSPDDFTSAVPFEVAGSRLVATTALPARRSGDRALTYFVVE